MSEDVSKFRLTGPENRGTKASPAEPRKKSWPSSTKQINRIVSDFFSRVKAHKGKDAGKTPGFVQRTAVASNWQSVVMASSLASLMAGKDYELARQMMEHYLTSDGDPLIYEPPPPVQ